ncbi:GAF domain-containing protein [Nocardia sp. NPDC052566]|uniref:GAF domain-containing protein n=1 Tax=Nocardia sp. NPDC052566 TaxID=3364330 RepID=UPI0037C6B8DF
MSNSQVNPQCVQVSEASDGHRLLVECLAGESMEPTVIVDNDGPHRFNRLFRALRRTDLASNTRTSVDAGLALLAQAARHQAPRSGVLLGHQRMVAAECIPVLGPSGAVHAIRVEVGDSGADGGTPVVPLEFDSLNIARFGRPHGLVPPLFRSDTTWTLPALLERVVWLDKRLELVAMFDPVDPASRWCESLVIDDPDTKSRRHLWMAARSASDQDGLRVVRGVIADITAIVPAPSRDPLIEHLSARTPRGHGSALMDLRTTLMHSFSCGNDPRMTSWRHRNPQIHPDDKLAVLQVLTDLACNRSAQIALRIRFTDEQPWTTLHAACTPLTNYSRPQANIDFWIENRN